MTKSIFSSEEDTRKRKIIRASLEIVDRMGVKGLTVARIAKAVGFTESALYRHFRSKKDIIALILNDAAIESRSQFAKIKKASQSPREQLRLLLRIHLEFLEAFPGLFQVIYSEEIHLGESRLLEKVNDIINDLATFLEEIIVQGKKTGQFKKNIDVSMTAVHFLGIVLTAFFYWSFKGKKERSLTQVGDRLLSQFFAGVEA